MPKSNKHFKNMAQLTGAELLAKIKELGAVTRDVIARETGYVKTKKDGTEQFQFLELYEATLAAKDVEFAPAPSSGRKLSYKATVQSSGNLILGKAYTAAHGAEPGDEFQIERLDDGAFKLTPIYEEGEAEAAAA